MLAAANLGGTNDNEATGFHREGSRYLFDFSFHEDATLNVPLDLGLLTDNCGLSLDVSTAIDLVAAVDFEFTFGIDLAQLATPAEAFFIQVRDLRVSAQVNVQDLDVAVQVRLFGSRNSRRID